MKKIIRKKWKFLPVENTQVFKIKKATILGGR
jgi:hypothetical protein